MSLRCFGRKRKDSPMAAMDLQCRLEHGEGRWIREEAELLERFDAERKEWESQLRDMQKNIEEVRSRLKHNYSFQNTNTLAPVLY